ncbi:MAG: M28 family peptidase, partial [Desulfosarcina sp.]|nr:M28 family peptidase [Desulfobacterales bacterium]
MPKAVPPSGPHGVLAAWTTAIAVWGWIGVFLLLAPLSVAAASQDDLFMQDVRSLAALGDRSTGSSGNQAAAVYIRSALEGLGFETVGSFRFRLPVRRYSAAALAFPATGRRITVHPLLANAVSPGTIAPNGLRGPLIYAGRGRLDEFNGREVAGAIVLMEMNSGRNWHNAANLGARALIYIDRGETPRSLFQDKDELTPIRFPRLWVPVGAFEDAVGDPAALAAAVPPEVVLTADVHWQDVTAENIFALVPGRNPKMAEQLLIVEAFYDSTVYVAAKSPGSDEACGIATLLESARRLKQDPPERSVLLLATDAHGQSLAGMREAVWNFHARSKYFVFKRKALAGRVKWAKKVLRALKLENLTRVETDPQLVEVVGEAVKSEVDRISRRLMRLRMEAGGSAAGDSAAAAAIQT